MTSEDKYRLLFNVSNDAIFVHGLDDEGKPGKYIEVNDVACQRLGYSREEMLELSPSDINSPEQVLLIPEMFKKLLEKGHLVFEGAHVTSEGREIPVEINTHIFDLEGKPICISMARDISKRILSEEALRESEERLRLLLENADDIIVMQDADGRYIYYNAPPIYGTNPEEVMGKTPLDIHQPELAQEIMERLKKVFESGQSLVAEEHMYWKDAEFYFVSQLSPVKDERGEVKAVVTVVHNVTAWKKAEEQLRRSEENFRNLAEQSPNMIFIHQDGRVVYVNDERILGHTIEEYLSPDFDFMSIIDPDSTDLVREMYRLHQSGRDVDPYECTLIAKNGRKIQAINSTKLINHNGKPAILGVVTDITRRKKAEEELRDSERKYSALFRHSNDGIFLHDLEGKIIDINMRALALVGYDKEELLSLKITDLRPPEEWEKSKWAYETILKDGVVNFEIDFLKKDGSKFPAEVSSSLFDIKGKKMIQEIVRDISDRKKAEEILRKAKEDLERQNVELMKLDKIRDNIIRDITHELKTPVAKQAMTLEMLKWLLSDMGLDKDVSEIFGVIESSVERQENVIRNMLTLSRLETGKQVYKKEPFRLDKVIKEAVEEYLQAIEAYEIKLSMDLEELVIKSDQHMLWHLFSNLINNAIKYRSREAEPVLDIKASRGEKGVVVRISDNGLGLTESENEMAFERFYQAYPSNEGIGVGLTISKIIANGLGGEIWLESEGRGKGTTAYVSLTLE